MADTKIRPTKPHFFKPLLPGFHNEFLIPIGFFKYLDGGMKCEEEDGVLRSRGGKIWPVKINGRHIIDGWRDFAKDHDLHEGDMLVFRHEGNLVFDVMVFDPTACERQYPPLDIIDVKPMPESFKCLNKLEETQKNKQIMTHTKSNATSLIMSGNPSFSATVNERSRLFIPKYFSRPNDITNGGCNCKMILEDQKQRKWSVKLGVRISENRTYFGHGWHDFCVANGLKKGDAFSFELIKKGNIPFMKFHRLEGNLTAKQKKSPKVKASPSSGNHMAKQEKSPIVKASSSSLGHPYFCGTINPSNLVKYQLKIPMAFARSNYLRNKCGEIFLKNKKGVCWPATLKQEKQSRTIYIGRGWMEFAVANGVKEGDEFKLELINGGKNLVMKYF